MLKYQMLGVATLAAVLGFTTRDAHAVDGKTYPGMMCRTAPGSAGSYQLHFGTVYNNSSTSELSLICPVVHDTGDISSATIKVWDRHPTIDVFCSVHFENVSGSSVFGSDLDDSSEGSSANIKTLTFGSQTGSDYTWVECTVPRSSSGAVSHIAEIDVVET
jgi:hypothetical protein